MIKALILDDELRARNVLAHYIDTLIPEVTQIKQAASVEEALQMLQIYSPDLVFLDVEMPVQNGFDFLKAIGEPEFEVIFVTAYNQYAIQAIRVSALDYLVKPIDPDDLRAAINRFLTKKKTLREKKELYPNLLANIDKNNSHEFRLAVPSVEGTYFFVLNDIIRLEANRNYTIIHLRDRKPFLASKTLRYFEELLEAFRFIRIHKSHLVNLQHVIRLSANSEFIILSDKSQIEVSRRKKEEVQHQLNLR